MKQRTFAWIALGAIVIAGNTALLVWLRGRPRSGAAPRRDEPSMPLPETRAVPRAPTPEEAALLAAAGVAAGEDRPRLRVSVVDAGGAPVAGAAVRAESDSRAFRSPFREPPMAEGTTGSDGCCDLSPNRRVRTRVVAERPGFARGEASVDGPEARVVLERAGAVRGRVVEDPSGAPLGDVTVRAYRDPARPEEVRTAGDGGFRLEGLRPGPWRVEASTLLLPPATATAEVPAGGEAAVEIRLRRGFTLRGRVVYQGSDRKADEGTVSWREEVWGRQVEGSTERSAAIGPDGRFVLGGLPGPVQDFRVRTGGNLFRVRGQRCVLDPKTGEQSGEIQVSLPGNNPPGLDYQGLVRDEEGKPVEGARVVAGWAVLVAITLNDRGREQERLAEAFTDAEGAFRIPPGRGWRLEAWDSGGTILALHPGYAPTLLQLPYRSRDRRFDLVLRRGASVLLTVRDATGRPAGNAEVYAFMIHTDPGAGRVEYGDPFESLRAHPLTDGAGRAVLPHVGPGPWNLAARSGDGREGGWATLEVQEGVGDLAVDLSLRTLPSASGRVIDTAGMPVAGAVVRAVGYGVDDLMTGTGRDGRFSFRSVFLSPPYGSPDSLLVTVQGRRLAGGAGAASIPLDGDADVVVEKP